MNLTKSDFILARECPTKLYYKKLRYPSLLDDDPYLEFLADGGYMVETMAKLLHPDGREIGNWDRPEEAWAETRQAIEHGNCTLFEPTIIHGRFLARVDILERFGSVIRLIEIKSSSVDTADGDNPFRGKRGDISSAWRPYLEDVTFQVVVLRRAFPGYEIIPHLCVVDKARTATPNSTYDKFCIRRGDGPQARFRPAVEYTGNAAGLANEHMLAVLNVSDEVAELADEVASVADEFAATIQADGVHKIPPVIGKKCKKCEYRTPLVAGQRNGFGECWGALAVPDPHALDLYRVDLVGGKNNDVVSEMAASGRARLDEIPVDLLSGQTAVRQRMQLEHTTRNEEFIDPDLKDKLRRHRYPLLFVDFEASRLAIPYHVGMQPYELAAFQWSCHTIRGAGMAAEHHAWLNDEDAFPNFAFARSLREAVGDEGTIYIWSPYERVVLRTIREQMEAYHENDPDLKAWLDRLNAESNPRFVDLCDEAKSSYFHPLMKGSLSIKSVLPAVWTSDADIRRDALFAGYVGYNGDGTLLNPYDTLPPLPIGGKEDVVNEGTGAMRVYQELMYGLARLDPESRQAYRQLLLQYCQLDTAAMVMIWQHWTK